VLRAVAARVALRPERPEGERMRPRTGTMSPSRRARSIAEPLARSARDFALLPPQPAYRQLPDLLPRAPAEAAPASPAPPARDEPSRRVPPAPAPRRRWSAPHALRR